MISAAVIVDSLLLSTLVKILADDLLKYFLYFSQKTGFDISYRLSQETTLHDRSVPVFWGGDSLHEL